MAVPEGDFFALYFDLDDDRLQSKVAPGTPVIEVELRRIEMRLSKADVMKAKANDDPEKPPQSPEGKVDEGVKLESPEVD